MYSFYLIVVILTFSINLVLSCTSPNGTDTKIHFFNCDNNLPIIITNVEIFDAAGTPMYPIDPKKSISIHLTAINNGIIYEKTKVKAKLFAYDLDDCSWSDVFTFGLLNNIDGCKYVKQCPLEIGNLERQITIEDMSFFGDVIGFLSGNENIYQFEIQMFDNNEGSNKEKIGCAIAQFQFVP